MEFSKSILPEALQPTGAVVTLSLSVIAVIEHQGQICHIYFFLMFVIIWISNTLM